MDNSNGSQTNSIDDGYSFIKEKLFVDLKLTLNDDSNKITIELHKIILCVRCIYFKKLLTNCKEKMLNEITIWVPNVYVAHDIIMSFYNHETNIGNFPNWKHILESAKCYDYFGLGFDKSLFTNLKVPKEGFELLLEVIATIDNDDKLIWLVKKNLPTDCVLSDELKNKIQKYNKYAQNVLGISEQQLDLIFRKPDRTMEWLRSLRENNS